MSVKMRGSSLLFKSQILIPFLIQVAGFNADQEDEANAFNPSQGTSQVLKTGAYVDDSSNTSTIDTKQTQHGESLDIDRNGYILYCPCMGRFGNQADQLLGALAFAKGLNRTLALPPWIVYPSYRPGSSAQIPFKKWFKLKPIGKYHRVVAMEDFMKRIAPEIWPIGKRIGFCFTFRGQNKCGMKEGNPFGPFWDHFGVDFDSYEEHDGLLWNSYVSYEQAEWSRRYPPSRFPVMAFQGAPGEFPSLPNHQSLQKYIKFSKFINEKAVTYIKEVLKNKPYVAIHLRNGGDMANVCKDIRQFKTLFASAQCTGYSPDTKLTQEMCLPSRQEILSKLRKHVSKENLQAIFVATDEDPMLDDIRQAFKGQKVSVHVRQPEDEADDPIVDIAIMTKADVFIGNCVSTFSAFVRRHRDSRNQESYFFGINN